MSTTPPANPDIKRELKDHLLTMSPRAFELFAGEFLVYVGLEKVSVTRYIGDGGIDAEGDLIAGTFRLSDRKSTRLNSSHQIISYAVFCLKKKRKKRYHKSMN